ncbi:MAG: phosphoadenylyl-sulfate reductase [Nitrososphaerota archaeon]|nr:phosphoadenylyl-sulfate reductase [Nitrososphaerota archaeon]MDG6923046.1 phosphoadenylyl-sulfate reductase [Nitrososphaerota archaeon]
MQHLESSREFETKSAQDIVRWTAERFGSKAALASSFGAEDMVLTDMISKAEPKITIFTLDTGRLPEETYKLMDETRRRYNMAIQVYFPDTKKTEEMVTKHGLNLFYDSVENRKICCGIRKVESLNRALNDKNAWLTGLRRDQTFTRTDTEKIAVDTDHNGILKISPLADWNPRQIWDYIRENNVPYNELHDKGYPSIGCEPCTRAVKEGEAIRSGRWWWEEGAKECGLHHKH